jgi:hypothetical protein
MTIHGMLGHQQSKRHRTSMSVIQTGRLEMGSAKMNSLVQPESENRNDVRVQT